MQLPFANCIVFVLVTLACMGCQTFSKKETAYQMRPFKEVTLSNGLPVLLVPDKKLPYFEMILTVKSGSTSDPNDRPGLSHLTAELLNKGTKKRGAVELAESFEQLGSSFSASSMVETTIVSGSSLSFHKDKLLKDFSEVLLEPAFDPKEIKLVKAETQSYLRRTVDFPRGMAQVLLQSHLYGSHPYSKNVLGTEFGVQKITREDIIQFHKDNYTPQNSLLTIVGNFDHQIVSQLESYLGHWKGGSSSNVTYTSFPNISGRQILLVDKPDLKQTEIRIAHKGIKRSNPDFLSLRIAHQILGHDFGSRLVESIRVKRGLTYSIGSRLTYKKDVGLFVVSTSTRHEKVGETIEETLGAIDKFIKSGVSQEELSVAKTALKANFPRALETAEAFGQTLMRLRFYGVPDSYLTGFYQQVDSVRTSQLNKIIKKYFHAKDVKIIIYGPKSKIMDQVRSLGSIETMDYKEFVGRIKR